MITTIKIEREAENKDSLEIALVVERDLTGKEYEEIKTAIDTLCKYVPEYIELKEDE